MIINDIKKLNIGDKIEVLHNGETFIGNVCYIDDININGENSQIWIKDATKNDINCGTVHMWMYNIEQIDLL